MRPTFSKPQLEFTFQGEAMRYRVGKVEEVIGPFTIRLQCITDIEKAIDEMFEELEARGCGDLLEDLCPYFGTVWPSARVLAGWAWEQGVFAFKGKRVLELGCGLALPSFVVSRLGAEVLATDLHPDVPEFLSRNLAENPGAAIRYQHLDWKAPRNLKSATRYDWILASDVLYESNQAESLVDFISQNLARNGHAVITDPGRAYWSTLVEMAENAGLRVTWEERAFKGGEKGVVLFLSGTKEGSELSPGEGSKLSGS